MTDSRGYRWLYELDEPESRVSRIDPLHRVHETSMTRRWTSLSTLDGGSAVLVGTDPEKNDRIN